jgi:hypothetical protein
MESRKLESQGTAIVEEFSFSFLLLFELARAMMPKMAQRSWINPMKILIERYLFKPSREVVSIIVPCSDIFIINSSQINAMEKENIEKNK